MLRLVVSQPENFRRGKTGERRVGDHLDQVFPSAGAAFDFLTFGSCALIVPQNGPPDDLIFPIEKHRAVHLARQPNRFHLRRFQFRFFHDGLDGLHRGLPPIVRILFAPQRLWVVEWVFGRRVGQDFPGFIDRNGLGARSTNVDP